MAKYVKNYSYKGYKIKETLNETFDIFKPSWDPNMPIFEEYSSINEAKEWINSDIKDDENERLMKENAVKEYAKRFNRILEYTFGTKTEITEDETDPNAQAADPNAAPADPNAAPPQGGDPNAAPVDPNADPNAQAQGGDPNAMPADPNAAPPEEVDGEYEDIDIEGEEGGLQPDDNVIDVSQITGAQQETNDEMKQLTDKFEQLLKLNDKVTQTLERLAQSAEESKSGLQSVKDDLAQRVPTEVEKLKGRTSYSEPFGNTVEDYWKGRSTGDKYDIYPNDEEQEYVLRKSDLESINPQTVYSSFNQKLRDIVGF